MASQVINPYTLCFHLFYCSNHVKGKGLRIVALKCCSLFQLQSTPRKVGRPPKQLVRNLGLEHHWFRAIWIHNGLLSFNSATFKQTLHADLKLVPRAKTSWASDILRAFEVLRGCDTYSQAFLQGIPIC